MAEANEDTSPKDDGCEEDVNVVEDEKNDPVVEDTTDKSTPSAEVVEEEGDWLDILGNGQIKKKILKKGGGTESRPVPSSTVVIRTQGSLEDGQPVDVNDHLKFTLGEGEVTYALDLAVTLMGVGEVAQVEAVPRFLYGEKGRPPDIPPNADITYEVELLSVEPPVDPCELDEKQLLEIVERKRDRGNWCFERKEYELAIGCFQKAGSLMEEYLMENESTEVLQQWMIKCWNNLAVSLMKLDLVSGAEEAVRKVLKIDPKNAKALYRLSKVLSMRGDYRKAVQLLKKATEENPEEKALATELERVEKLLKQSLDKEKAMYRRMIDGLGKKEKSSQAESQSQTSMWPYVVGTVTIAVVGIGLAFLFSSKH